ncbi:MAG TPA: hypothetical protein RMH85_29655 [Polyangiaceae bacterium LLY-WYZ-15_(1-7)]|nr:hypothetical protein [Polyangiaceae bacterium LLY-WYZ-15_(1-7)]HJL12684.1 hypothetical protein [Polyangiaceae bacterium LLY-WYZ-15_(1-7)]HJL25600.1 hypothetical protein [Polyangiaceae bacterium LLY-WYZ-15_(1-7)]HJL28659.1 hypothetical protein [Polyangiaceae bacterium LLY-WYZ-15_(1-7)]
MTLVAALAGACGFGGTPDPRNLEGAMAYAALAVERDDPAMLFRIVDARARHAMISIVNDRRAAASLVRETYPEAERAAALARLGDAAEVESARELFARRCDAACRSTIGGDVGKPERTETEGEETIVHTARGTTVRVWRAEEGDWWGLVWHTDELDEERARANRDLRLIEENAETYRRRRELEGSESDAPTKAD